jgi:hypothetical protein
LQTVTFASHDCQEAFSVTTSDETKNDFLLVDTFRKLFNPQAKGHLHSSESFLVLWFFGLIRWPQTLSAFPRGSTYFNGAAIPPRVNNIDAVFISFAARLQSFCPTLLNVPFVRKRREGRNMTTSHPYGCGWLFLLWSEVSTKLGAIQLESELFVCAAELTSKLFLGHDHDRSGR